jgi:hypothetical protein
MADTYHIRVKGQLDASWSEWFDGLIIASEENGESILSGPIADQAALHGILARVRDLGLPLVAVARGEEMPSTREREQIEGEHER